MLLTAVSCLATPWQPHETVDGLTKRATKFSIQTDMMVVLPDGCEKARKRTKENANYCHKLHAINNVCNVILVEGCS